MDKYKWKLEWLAKGIAPEAAAEEIESIENKYGSITPENVLQASVDTDALLHPLFEWNDTVAAHQHRLSQARTIINNIHVLAVKNDEAIYIPLMENVKNEKEEPVYISIENMNETQRKFVLFTSAKELERIKTKLENLDGLGTTVKLIDAAIDTIPS